MLLGDVNAEVALVSSIGLTALVLMVYYLRMIGLYRIQIAIGGAGLGIGIFLALFTCLAEIGVMFPIFPNIPSYITLFVSAVSIIAGILNTAVHR
jgi:hypothetical protein